jgi:hypothetical protein
MNVKSILIWIAKVTVGALTVLGLIAVLLMIWLWPDHGYLPARPVPFEVERLLDEPIVHVGLSQRLSDLAASEGYPNVNGPSLIRVPDWIPNPLGRYYLYFAHHKGDHIRLAYADRLEGPWSIHDPGSLSLDGSIFPSELVGRQTLGEVTVELWKHFSVFIVRDMLMLGYRSAISDQAIRKERGIEAAQNAKPHIASPDVVIDDESKRLLMYYHGLSATGAQFSRVAISRDGVDFEAAPEIIPSSYLRAFEHRGDSYLLGMPGVLYRSTNGTRAFEPRDRLLFEPRMRHAGLWLRGETLYVIWSRVGDAPERLLVSQVDLSPPDWDDWQATSPQRLMHPELPWEGSELEVQSSLRGELGVPAHELRDPDVFIDEGGAAYLLYVGGGERAIGIGRLVDR